MLFGRRFNRRNRNLLTGMLIIIGSLALVVVLFGLTGSELLRFFLISLLFVGTIIVLALAALVAWKGLARLFKRRRDDGP